MALALPAPGAAPVPGAWAAPLHALAPALPRSARPPPADAGAGGRLPLDGEAVAGGALAVALAAAARRRGARAGRRAFRDDGTGRGRTPVQPALKPFKEPEAPADLYQLLQVPVGADKGTIKQSYYKLQKICHPDVAGPDGEEMCMLLNDAYDVLTDQKTRTLYDEQLRKSKSEAIQKVEVSTDLGPTWKWRPKKHGAAPVWNGTPRSMSRWDRLSPENRGEKHTAQKFVYVDEWTCISCRNCCDIAPKSFCIDIEHGRARVYSQWGDTEEYLDYAVQSCPVDCIHWVGREELQALEHVTAKKMFENGSMLPCSMAIRNGMAVRDGDDPFDLANRFIAKLEKEKKREKMLGLEEVKADKFQERIFKAFVRLSDSLRLAGWG